MVMEVQKAQTSLVCCPACWAVAVVRRVVAAVHLVIVVHQRVL